MDTILSPVLALICWSLVVWIWLYATRLPAMQQAKIDPATVTRAQVQGLPPWAANVAENYNHLMEQPTIFYALAFYIYLAGQENGTNVALAWGYVGLRVAHSLVQGTINFVPLRFGVFALSSLCLFGMAIPQLIGLLTTP